jgi:hypothetical protein
MEQDNRAKVHAPMAELADAAHSKCASSRSIGSSPIRGTGCRLKITGIVRSLFALVAQWQEAADLKSVQCGFESRQAHSNKAFRNIRKRYAVKLGA